MSQSSRFAFKLPRTLGSIETWGFGFSGLLLWLGTAPAMNAALGLGSLWVWIPGAVIGTLLNLQVRQLGIHDQDRSGGTPNYATQLLHKFPFLARYSAIGYWLGWVSVPPMNAIILTDLIQVSLEPLGVDCPVTAFRILFTLLPYIVTFSNSRTVGILHAFFVIPAISCLLVFCLQGFSWLSFSPQSPGLFAPIPFNLDFTDWAKWFFVAIYAVYGCETASSFVADSRKPRRTLDCLVAAAIALPIVYVLGSWLLARLAISPRLGDSAYLHLMATAGPFWGSLTPGLVTFLIASGCLLSSATAVSNCPRVLYQLAQDRHLPALFSVVSPRGVLEPGLLFTLGVSLLCLAWGNVSRVVMVTGTGYLSAMMGIHLGLWLQRKRPEVRWPRWSLLFLVMEAIVFVVGGLAWGWQDWLIGLLLPMAVGVAAQGVGNCPIALCQPAWWSHRYRPRPINIQRDWVVFQVTVLILLLCGAVSIGWFARAGLDRFSFGSHGAVFSIVLITVAFLGVAIACWTSLSQMAAMTEARDRLERTLSELQRTQLQLVQSEKMSSLGQLVAGVAHEINNPVNFIYGNLEHVRTYAQDLLRLLQLYAKYYPEPVAEIQEEQEAIELDFLEEDLTKILASMKVGSDRIREIVLSLRNFSRLDEAELKAVDLHEGIDSTITILKHRLKAKANRPAIDILREYGNLPPIECYPGQFNQVIMNILSNAIDALEEATANRDYQDLQVHRQWIRIRTRIQEIELPSTNSTGSSLSDGKSSTRSKWLVVGIADNGPGIPPDIQRRIFDPFFTTKPIGKGTGMGMSISYQIVVEKHQGKLECFSQVGEGTEFLIQIPLNLGAKCKS